MFERARAVVDEIEGGIADVPGDRGRLTNRGVTQGRYNDYRDAKGLPRQKVTLMTPEEAEEIYEDGYWIRSHAHELAWPLSLVHFDAAVNHGPHNAMRFLQEALGVRSDGMWGPVTRTAAIVCDPIHTANKVLWIRVRKYVALAGQKNQLQFLRGWLNRLLRLREEF